MACGNPPSFARAGELGLGAIAFNFEPIFDMKGRLDAYKEAAEACTEPLGQYQNNNIMMTNAVICLNDRARAREHYRAVLDHPDEGSEARFNLALVLTDEGRLAEAALRLAGAR